MTLTNVQALMHHCAFNQCDRCAFRRICEHVNFSKVEINDNTVNHVKAVVAFAEYVETERKHIESKLCYTDSVSVNANKHMRHIAEELQNVTFIMLMRSFHDTDVHISRGVTVDFTESLCELANVTKEGYWKY